MASNFMFQVPNDNEGKYFIKMMRKYAQNGVKFRLYGRHPQRRKVAQKARVALNNHGDMPLSLAKTLVVYVTVPYENGRRAVIGPSDAIHNLQVLCDASVARMRLENAQRAVQKVADEIHEALKR